MASKVRKIFNLIIAILIVLPTISIAATSMSDSTLMDIVRDMVGQWYFIFRYFSISLMLVVLIYLGIKIAISSIAEEKAKYKRMLVDWVIGFIIIFIIHYYMILIVTLNEKCVDLVEDISGDLAQKFVTGEEYALGLKPSTQGLYEMVRTRAYELRFSLGTSGMIMYMVLVYYTIKFIFIYFKRFFTVLILTILAPLMGLFYAFNKIMTGKAATFKKWASEYAFNVFLQTIHAIAYGIFVTLAIGLSSQSIAGFILAMVMLNFMGNAEKIMRKIFKLSGGLVDDNANKGIKENLAAATAMKASMGAVFGSQMVKDIGQGIKNTVGGAGNLVAFGVLSAKNNHFIKNEEKGLEKAKDELAAEMKKDEKDRSAEKIRDLEHTIAKIGAKKAKIEKYRGGIKDPEKLQAKIDKATKGIKDQAEKNRIEAKIREENDKKIIRRGKYKNVITGQEEMASIGKVLKGEINTAIWGNDAVKAETKDLVKTTASGIAGAFMTMISIPMIVTEPVAGLALLAKGRQKSKPLFSNNEYRKVTNLSERNAIRAGQRKIRKRQNEEIKKIKKERKTIKKQRKALRKPINKEKGRKLSFNRFNARSLETIKSQIRMDTKLNAIRKINSLSLGSLALTAPFRLTGTLGAVRTIQSKAYRIQEARKDYYENLETFATLEKKESISKDFILDYNVKVEGIRKAVDAKSNSEIIERFNEDTGKVVKVGNNKFQFGQSIKTSSNPVEIKSQIIDNVLLKVAAKNKVLDIKDLNLKSNKIQTQLAEEFRKVGVLNETIISEEFEIDKTLKLNIDKLKDRIQIISKENPKAVEETIAKEVIVDYMERNKIEDANEIKKEEHKEKIKQEILEIIEEKEESKPFGELNLFEETNQKQTSTTDFSKLIFDSAETLGKNENQETLTRPDLEETQKFEKVTEDFVINNKKQEKVDEQKLESKKVESLLDSTENKESSKYDEIIREIKSESKIEEVETAVKTEDSKFKDFDFMKQRLESTIKVQEKKAKKEERIELFENLINSIKKSEPSITEKMVENEFLAEERKRQIEIEKDKLDSQLEGFEKIIDEDLDDSKAIEDYIENQTSPEVDELLAQLLALKEQDMAGIALKFKPNSHEQKRMNSIDLDRINSTYKKKI